MGDAGLYEVHIVKSGNSAVRVSCLDCEETTHIPNQKLKLEIFREGTRRY